MNETIQYLTKLELELRRTHKIASQFCGDFYSLPEADRCGLWQAIGFLGCQPDIPAGCQNAEIVPEVIRIQAIRLMYIKLYVDTGEPRWSSLTLERLIEAALAIPGAGVNDTLYSLFSLLAEVHNEVTRPMTNFTKQVTTLCFTRYRTSYDSANFSWLIGGVDGENFTPAQAYFALHACPQRFVQAIRSTIIGALQSSSYRDEAIRALSDDDKE